MQSLANPRTPFVRDEREANCETYAANIFREGVTPLPLIWNVVG